MSRKAVAFRNRTATVSSSPVAPPSRRRAQTGVGCWPCAGGRRSASHTSTRPAGGGVKNKAGFAGGWVRGAFGGFWEKKERNRGGRKNTPPPHFRGVRPPPPPLLPCGALPPFPFFD